MAADQFDLIVLGAGSAARDAASRAADDYDANVALIESTRWGGSCPNVACNPTKAYLVSAELAHDVNELAGLLGIEAGPAKANLAKVKARKDELLKPQPNWLEELSGSYTTIKGVASFVDANAVRVGQRELASERILIATGSRTAVPPIDGLDEIDWLDHVSALELTELPDSLLVVGGGPVGLELAQAFARFGSDVTIVEGMERIAGKADEDAAQQLARALEAEGIEILTSTIVKNVQKEGRDVVATLEPRDDGDRELQVRKVLIASGRKPNVDALELENARVETNDEGYVEVDDRLRTSADGIWAAGDVTGKPQFTPLAQYQARIATKDMFEGDAPAADYSALPTVIFTDPELAALGLTEHEANEKGLKVETAAHELAKETRARYKNLRHGLFKLVYEQGSRRLVGLHVVAPNASDVVAGFAVALKLGATVDDLARAQHAYPTFGEGVKAAAERATAAVITL